MEEIREDGFYLVKIQEGDEWQVAEWFEDHWIIESDGEEPIRKVDADLYDISQKRVGWL